MSLRKISVGSLFKHVTNDWKRVLSAQKARSVLVPIINKINSDGGTKYRVQEMFKFAHFPLNNVKCIIIDNTLDCKNISKKLNTQIDLDEWYRQGVLVITGALVEQRWSSFVDFIIQIFEDGTDILNSVPVGLFGIEKKICDDCTVFRTAASSSNDFDVSVLDKLNNAIQESSLVESMPKITWIPRKQITMYTDGSCINNGRGPLAIGGFAVYIPDECKVLSKSIPPAMVYGKMVHPSSIRAEGLAILHALQYAKKNKITDVHIVTDSQFWIKQIETYMPNWDARDIEFTEKKNPDITEPLYELSKSTDLTLTHIMSHGKDKNADPAHIKGNSIADRYAQDTRFYTDFVIHEDDLHE